MSSCPLCGGDWTLEASGGRCESAGCGLHLGAGEEVVKRPCGRCPSQTAIERQGPYGPYVVCAVCDYRFAKKTARRYFPCLKGCGGWLALRRKPVRHFVCQQCGDTPATMHVPNHGYCPKCLKGHLVARKVSDRVPDRPFLMGCTRFPRCRYLALFDPGSYRILKELTPAS